MNVEPNVDVENLRERQKELLLRECGTFNELIEAYNTLNADLTTVLDAYEQLKAENERRQQRLESVSLMVVSLQARAHVAEDAFRYITSAKDCNICQSNPKLCSAHNPILIAEHFLDAPKPDTSIGGKYDNDITAAKEYLDSLTPQPADSPPTKGPTGMCSCDPKFQPDRAACWMARFDKEPGIKVCSCRCHEPEWAQPADSPQRCGVTVQPFRAQCMLLKGHEGEHRVTADSPHGDEDCGARTTHGNSLVSCNLPHTHYGPHRVLLADGRIFRWEPMQPADSPSRHEQITCAAPWFWNVKRTDPIPQSPEAT